MVRIAAACAALLLLALPLAGQPAPAQAPRDQPSVARVRAVLEHLASDELAGRDSPSPGLEQAADWIADAFAAAGLEPLGAGEAAPDRAAWFHPFALPGLAVAADGARLAIHAGGERHRLEPGADFRVWECGRAFAQDGLPFAPETAAAAGDPRAERRALAGRALRLFVVAEDDPAWRAAAGGRTVLSRRGPGGAPVILIREGAVPEGAATVDAEIEAPRAVDVPLRNVVGVLRGAELPDEYVVVSAHYDHVGIRPRAGGGDGVHNGADDNATGTTAVVCLAERFGAKAERPRRSLLFVAFAAEEKGLRGSRAFCEAPPVPLAAIAAVVNLEMLGRPDGRGRPYAWITGAELSDFAAIAQPALAAAGVELSDYEMAGRLFRASDNYPFAQKGVVAHSISAGTLHEDYHRPGDEAAKIDVGHMAAVIGGIEQVVRAFADRDGRPRYLEAGRQALGLDR